MIRQITVEIYTYSYLDLMEYIKNNDINIYNFKKKDEFKFQFETSFLSYCKLKKNYKYIKIRKSNSIITFFIKVFSEKLVIFSLIISSLLYIFLSNLIFGIKVEGTSEFLNKYIINELKINNIEEFNSIPNLDELKNIERNIYINNIDKFDLFSITRKGNFIYVNYQIKKKNLLLDEIKTKIYSKKDAVISKILVSNGIVLVKENEFVKENQLLVDDHILINNEACLIGTKGIIYGYTFNKVEIEYTNFEEAVLQSRYLVSKDFIFDERIIEEKIIFHDEINKKVIFHYKCEEILNSF